MNILEKAGYLLRQLQYAVRLAKSRERALFLVVTAMVAFLLASGTLALPNQVASSFQGLFEKLVGKEAATPLLDALPALLWLFGVLLLLFVIARLWRQATPPLPTVDTGAQPAAIKGPLAFTEQDADLFRQLERDRELKQLRGWVSDPQTGLVVVMGEAGAGKTSLLRAGLGGALANAGIGVLYWECLPGDPDQKLLRAAQGSWQSALFAASPQSLDELLASPVDDGLRVVVLDQFEQLRPERADHAPVFDLLRQVAEQGPPYRCTWLVAFREEYSAPWWKFQQALGLQPPMVPVERFSPEQARGLVATLANAAGLKPDQALVNALIQDATQDGRVSPVDIGIGLMMLDGLARQLGRTDLVERDYSAAGVGPDGLLAGYVVGRLGLVPAWRKEPLLKAMLALADLDTGQRLASGRSGTDLADALGESVDTLRKELDVLAGPNFRLLEPITGEDGAERRYRLPHERLVPVLRRLSGAIMAAAEQARMTFERAFRSWRDNDERPHYLLGGAELDSTLRHRRDFHWGTDADAKQRFLLLSHRRRQQRRLGYAATFALVVVLAGSGWQWDRWNGHRTDLERWTLPHDLHHFQRQLEILVVESGTMTHVQWLEPHPLGWLQAWLPAGLAARLGPPPRALTELHLKAPRLAELRGIPQTVTDLSVDSSALWHLHGLPRKMPALAALDLRGEMTDLSGLPAELPKLAELSVRNNYRLTSLFGLPLALPALTELAVNYNTRLTNIEDLPVELPELAALSLTSEFGLASLSGLPAELPALAMLDLERNERLTDLSDIPAQLPELAQLSLEGNWRLTDLSGLAAELPALAALRLAENPILTDLSGLPAELPALAALRLAENPILTDLSGLPAELPALAALSLAENPNLTSLSGLPAELPALASLSLVSNSNLIDLLSLPQRLDQLERLTIQHNDSLRCPLDLPAELPALISLTIDRCLTDIASLPGMPRIETVVLSGSEVTSLDGLADRYPNLRTLDIRETKVRSLRGLPELGALSLEENDSLTDLSGLPAELPALAALNLIQNEALTDLSGLPAELPALAALSLSSNEALTDLSRLPKRLDQLERLAIQHNDSLRCPLDLPAELPALISLTIDRCLTDIASLPRMPRIETLVLSHSEVTSLNGLADRFPNLRTLDIRRTKVRSLRGLPAFVTTLYVGETRDLTPVRY